MRELLDKIESWRQQGQQVALATVVKVYGSAPRPLGAKMAISSSGEMVGSVSGGCVEGAVIEEAQSCIVSRQPKLIPYGITDETAWSVGLACGGQIEVFVESLWGDPNRPISPAQQNYEILLNHLRKEIFCAQVTILEGNRAGGKLVLLREGGWLGTLGDGNLDRIVAQQTKNIWKSQQPIRLNLEDESGKLDIFVDVFPPRDKLIIVGGVHISIPLVHFARALGFHTTVVDARAVFGSRERFPEADELIVAWPAEVLEKMDIDESTYIAVVSHDDKLDIPALKVALSSKARYIGVLGSERTQAKRVAALSDMGVPQKLIKHMHAPIGIELGAVGAEEIALSIVAEMIRVKRNIRKN